MHEEEGFTKVNQVWSGETGYWLTTYVCLTCGAAVIYAGTHRDWHSASSRAGDPDE